MLYQRWQAYLVNNLLATLELDTYIDWYVLDHDRYTVHASEQNHLEYVEQPNLEFGLGLGSA